MMRRWIAIFILILPLQFSWAAVASYCQHESEPAKTEHIGHHEHKHADTDTVGKTKKSEPSLDKSDRDCRLCGGLGLGLSLCETLAQGMGGEISAGNQATGGAEFTLKLPLSKQQTPST